YFRQLYFKENPAAYQMYNTLVAAPACDNGDFETASFTNYYGESGTFNLGECNLTPITFTPDGSIPNGNFAIIDNSVLPTNPYTPISTVHGGNYSARINQDVSRYGINKLVKPIILASANEQVAFWYALVLEHPS